METFIIKSLYVQNTVMLIAMGLAATFLVHSVIKKRPKHIGVFSIWVFLILWFFNSPFFGFSAVTVSPVGIKLNYGILSIRNDLLPLESEWEIRIHLSGIRKNKRLHYLVIGRHESMRVKGKQDLKRLEEIGEAIERIKGAGSIKGKTLAPIVRGRERP